MMKVKLCILAITASVLLLAIPLADANGPVAKTNKNMTTTTTAQSAWPAETLSGKITMVDPAHKVVVEPLNGVPFDLVVTAKTRIKSGEQAITFEDLTRDMNKTVSVRFTPDRSGDVAKSIQING